MEFFLTQPHLKSYVDALGISPENTRLLFRLLDTDESGRIDLEEFCDGCLRLQGEAKSVDVHAMMYQEHRFMAMPSSQRPARHSGKSRCESARPVLNRRS